jgi:Alpha amylase, catalytic domain
VNAWPDDPVVHEIFAWVWLAEMSAELGRTVTLGDVPGDVWDDVARPGIDAVWLMGVWQRSPAGAAIARTHPSLRAAHVEALPDFVDDDVVGSAYCIREYVVDARLGGEEGLASARAALAARDVRLVLDFVPNHVAPDHPWTREHPEYFIRGDAGDLARDPASFIEVDGSVFACGRDPYFPAWSDVVQLDASRPDVRQAMAGVMVSLTERCDGVRCDMAMLVLDDVFWRTWDGRASGGERPDDGRGFWPTVIGAARAVRLDFAVWAEAYWDLEHVLLEHGFDACYDKRLYDRMVRGASMPDVRAHLAARLEDQRHTVRFVENHDEPRAASVLGAPAHRAALVALLTLPGVALLHEGGADGRRVRVPVTLGRRPAETLDAALRADIERLLDHAAAVRRGQWELTSVEGWADNNSAERLLAWTWTNDERWYLIVVNLTDQRADGRIRLSSSHLGRGAIELDDVLSGEHYERDADQVEREGLYVALDGWNVHLFEVAGRR